jgi:SSS family solute:Na+ symporter
MTFAAIDYWVITFYFGLIWLVGFWVSKRKSKHDNEKEHFLLAGRKITLPLFVASLVATWYGNILGIGEFVWNEGLLAWFCFCLPYYVTAAVFAGIVAKRIRTAGSSTIPEQIEKSYGRSASIVSAAIVLIITIPASYILMLGTIIQIFSGWDLLICIIVGAALSLAFLFAGGFRADVLTNTVQFVLMYAGFAVLLIFSYQAFGGVDKVLANLPATHLEPLGSKSWQYVAVWFVIAMQTFVDPSFHQRCAAAKTPKTAQSGIIISIALWAVFDLMTMSAGFYARAFVSPENPVLAYPALAEAVLPPLWKGFFIVAILSVIMSTLDSYAFISGATIGVDILGKFKFFHGKIPDARRLTQIGLAATAVLGVIMAAAVPSVIDLIFKTASIAVPALIIPLVLTYTKRFSISPNTAALAMSLPALASAVWMALSTALSEENSVFAQFLLSVEPMAVGIAVSILSAAFLVRRRSSAAQS